MVSKVASILRNILQLAKKQGQSVVLELFYAKVIKGNDEGSVEEVHLVDDRGLL